MEIRDLKLTDRRKRILESLNLFSIKDILEYYPYRYEYYKRTPFISFKENSNVLFECVIISKPVTSYFGRRNVTRFKVLFEDNELNISIFNRNWINRLAVGSRIVVQGKYEGKNKVIASNYYQKTIEEVEGIKPIYSLKEGISLNDISKIIEIALEHIDDEICDYIPNDFIEKHHLIDYKKAIYYIHKPDNEENLKMALARIKYNEFLDFFSFLNVSNLSSKADRINIKKFNDEDINKFISDLPFDLTIDQKTSLNEILDDLRSNKTLRRLLQGDVGSGKTIISEIALYANYLSNYQGALMAPTEVLAYQHYNNFKKIFKNTNVNIELLTSSVKEKNSILDRLYKGEINILIGTHSLFQKEVIFSNLGLVVVDEQQRFGVKQRSELKKKGDNTDILLMSATPIPRTLANTLYGDLDISTIKTIPSSRIAPDTYFINSNSIFSILNDLKEVLNNHNQVYIVASSINQSDNIDIKDLNRLFESISNYFDGYKTEMLHGKMDNFRKKEIMDRFSEGDINILVSTSVIEVGIDVSNATCMVIYNAERFGLSQLHQLRGRIQRSSVKGKVYLLSDTKDEEAINRLNALCKTNDGFEISLMDLKQRGPGDIIGTKQSGLPSFHLANIVLDTKILNGAREDSFIIFKDNSSRYKEYKDYIYNLQKYISID